jgi:hypothetical protein
MKNQTIKESNNKRKLSGAKKKSTSVITTTYAGKTISFRILSSTEIKATRNSAYEYLK